jgi:hypothetical protein
MNKRVILSGVGGLLLGALIILGIRFFTYHSDMPHYHANFAVYINDKRIDFKEPYYYEEVAGSCAAGHEIKPAQRAHLHDNVGDTVHVHDDAVTWGAFFQNIRWAIGPDFVKTQDAIYTVSDTEKVNYFVNGQAIDDVSNQVIQSKDRLLVDFGDTDSKTLEDRMKKVASSAAKFNTSTDPAACMGAHQVTWKDRLKHLF